MKQVNSLRFRIKLSLVTLAFGSLPASAVEMDLAPKITSSFIHVVDGAYGENNLKDVEAWTLSPELGINFNGAVWKGSWQVDHNEIKQVKSEFDDASYTDYSLNNSFSWWQDRISLSIGASRKNQNINRGQGGVTDQIFSNKEFVDVDNYSAAFSIRNRANSPVQVQLQYQFSDTDFDEV
jgi:hypothetical protein